MTVKDVDTEDPATWDDLFVRDVDERLVEFVRPADTERPTWAAYEAGAYLGTVSAEADDGRTAWRVQTTREAHRGLEDVVRALRRPSSWPREREQAVRWARRLLADETLTAVDVQSTGLDDAFAVRIVAVTPGGGVVFDEYVRPEAVIEPAAVAVHRITPERVAQAATFGELLPRLSDLLHGRTLVSHNAGFDIGVFERELARHHGDLAAAGQWLGQVRWQDAMVPYAVWQGLWSVDRGTYRDQPLGGRHDAVADARLLLRRLEEMAASVPAARWA